MTTICVDIEKRKIVADSRVTKFRDGVVSYETGAVKVYQHPTGKITACGSGDVKLTRRSLRKLGFNLHDDETDNFTFSKGSHSDIIIMNKFNNQAHHIHTKYNGRKVVETKRYIAANSHITLGSGGDVANKVFERLQCAEKAVYYAAMKDKYTDDNLTIVKY